MTPTPNPVDLIARLWAKLEQAAGGTYPAWRQAVLCSRRDDGGDGRMVVLRGARAQHATLDVYTDIRAEKVAQCATPVTMVFWDEAQQLQLRLTGRAQVLTAGESVETAWQHVGPHSRDNYRGALAPGARVDDPESCAQLAPGDGRSNFGVLCMQVDAADALWLEAKRRMQARRSPQHGNARDGWDAWWVQQ